MMLTLFADASHCPKTGACGWGAWARRDGWDKGEFLGAQFKTPMKNIAEAELCALANALYHLDSKNLLDGVTGIMLQSDNLRCLSIIASRVPNVVIRNHEEAAKVPLLSPGAILSKIELKAVPTFETIRLRLSYMAVRHVKGHKAGEGRQWVNRQCDEIAGKHMQDMRVAMKKKGQSAYAY